MTYLVQLLSSINSSISVDVMTSITQLSSKIRSWKNAIKLIYITDITKTSACGCPTEDTPITPGHFLTHSCVFFVYFRVCCGDLVKNRKKSANQWPKPSFFPLFFFSTHPKQLQQPHTFHTLIPTLVFAANVEGFTLLVSFQMHRNFLGAYVFQKVTVHLTLFFSFCLLCVVFGMPLSKRKAHLKRISQQGLFGRRMRAPLRWSLSRSPLVHPT